MAGKIDLEIYNKIQNKLSNADLPTLKKVDKMLSKVKMNQNVQPKTKFELRRIIEDTIEEKGINCDLNFIDTSLITDMSYLFTSMKFNGDISKWNVSNVKNMSFMFKNSKFNGDISQWNVSNVENMYCMFDGSNFNRDINKWDVSNVKNMDGMFADSKFNQPLDKWHPDSCKNMDEMFAGSDFDNDLFYMFFTDYFTPFGECESAVGMFKDSKYSDTKTVSWHVQEGADIFKEDGVNIEANMDDIFVGCPVGDYYSEDDFIYQKYNRDDYYSKDDFIQPISDEYYY